MDVASAIEPFIGECWARIFGEVPEAAVYIDHAAAECLHWYTGGKGYLALKNAGALTVQELAMYNFRYAEVKGTKKAVIIATSDDVAFYRRTIKMIMAKNAFEICTILCAAQSRPNGGQTPQPGTVSFEEKLDYAKLKRHVKDWMSTKSVSQEPLVSVSFVPFFVALLSDDLFVTPSFANLLPPLDSVLTPNLYAEAENLATSLQTLFERINVREDVYAVGKMSEYIAEKLESLASDAERRSNLTGPPQMGVSLILVDRTLDLCTPTTNDTDCCLTRILRTLPRLSYHDNDVAISMSGLYGSLEGAAAILEVPGCLASTDAATIDMLISEKSKTILTLASKTLNDALFTKESPRAKTAMRVSAHSLQKLVDKLRDTDRLDLIPNMSKKIQAILAVIAASTSDKSAQLELLTSLEKLALQNLSVSGESSSILAQLSNIIRTRVSRGLDIENLFALLIYVYALAGTQVRFTSEQEGILEKSIAEAVHQDIRQLKKNLQTGKSATTSLYQRTLLLLGVNDEGASDDVAKEASRKVAAHITSVLRAIATQRSSLQDYKSLMMRTSSLEAARRVGILEQLTMDIMQANVSSELRDLRQSSPSLVSAGFNLLLRGRTRRHPRDNSWILIYVVGGITPEEVRIVREVISSTNGSSSHVTLAGSRLLNPADIVDKILLSTMNDR